MDFEGAKQFIREKLSAGLPDTLSYHSLVHIMDVYDVAGKLAAMEGVKGEELTMLLTAALFHDSGFLISRKDHEKLSCDCAMEHLPKFGYSTEQIKSICGMIMATKLPQTPHNLLEEIICDADLDYLGREDFWSVGNRLFNELKIIGIVSNDTEWNEQQVTFLEKHRYFTKSAIALRKAGKEAHLAEVKTKLSA